MTTTRIAAFLFLLVTLPCVSSADEEKGTPPQEKGRSEEPAPRYEPPEAEASKARASSPLLYVPPAIGEPARRIGAGTRGMGRQASIQILAPDHLGYTTEEQPTLYWYLAEATTTPVVFTIRDENSIEPLIEAQLAAPAQAGVQAVRLADHGMRIAPGTNYQWFVSLVPEPERRSKDFTVGAWIARREPDAALRGKLAAANGREAIVFAESGLWYDAIDALSSQIASAPADRRLRAQRAALLEQAGLAEVAAYDLAAAGP
ncbi:MAG: DUF928 domain-containing protein [Myxococcota bacterium]